MLQDRQGTSKMKACDVSAGARALLPSRLSGPERCRAPCSLQAGRPQLLRGQKTGQECDLVGANSWPLPQRPLFLPHFGSTLLVLMVGEGGGLVRPLLILQPPAPTPRASLGTSAGWGHTGVTSALQVLTCPNASFTDLAEIVSRIEPARVATVDGELGTQDVHPHGRRRGWQRLLLTPGVPTKPPWLPGPL